jgi:Septum formation
MGEGIRWLIGLGIGIAGLIIAWEAWQHPRIPPAAAPIPSTAPAGVLPGGPPTVGGLKLSEFQVGDCLTGEDLKLNTSDLWPEFSLAVPCSQAHTAEVFLANNNYWNSGSYPGYNATVKASNSACADAFRSYVGTSDSIYDWTDVIPYASSWSDGFRGLYCVAYYPTYRYPAGAVIRGSLKGADR